MDKKYQMRSSLSKFKTRDADGKKYINGYFVVFNSNYQLWDGATESVDPHAFDGTLDSDIRCLIDHDTRLVLGRTKSGTLTLKVDDKGLWGEVEINESDQDAMNLYARVQRGDVDQCSFGFEITSEEYSENGNGVHWTIKSVNLYEVSVVTFPAYEDTQVSARKKEFNTIRSRKLEQRKKEMLKRLKGE